MTRLAVQGWRGAIAMVLAALLLAVTAIAAENLTFPALTGRVVDEAGILNPADQAALTGTLAALEARSGAQLVVVTLKSLRGTTIEDYGYQLGRAWGIGRKDSNSGALLIVAPVDRAVRIEVGYGLEGTLTDAATKTIIEAEILPRFRAGDIPGGIKNGAARIAQILSVDATAPPPAISTPAGDISIWPIIVGGLICVWFLIHCAIHGGGLCQFVFQMLYMMALSGGRGGGGGSDRGSTWPGGGGSFGGGGASGRW